MQTAGIPGAAINYLSMAAFFFHMQGQLHEAWRVFQQAIGLGTPPRGPSVCHSGSSLCLSSRRVARMEPIGFGTRSGAPGDSLHETNELHALYRYRIHQGMNLTITVQ
jgi:hypothetical protein